jgi:large subunit ribosomal protein L13
MDMNRAFFLKNEDKKPQWIMIDAQGIALGRLATKVADILRGKNKPFYTPHTDSGDYVVIVNAQDVLLTGNKRETKTYVTYSGWIGGQKEKTLDAMMKQDPTQVIELAVKRMLPKSKMGAAQLKKLRIYAGAEHPHQAQIAKAA